MRHAAHSLGFVSRLGIPKSGPTHVLSEQVIGGRTGTVQARIPGYHHVDRMLLIRTALPTSGHREPEPGWSFGEAHYELFPPIVTICTTLRASLDRMGIKASLLANLLKQKKKRLPWRVLAFMLYYPGPPASAVMAKSRFLPAVRSHFTFRTRETHSAGCGSCRAS